MKNKPPHPTAILALLRDADRAALQAMESATFHLARGRDLAKQLQTVNAKPRKNS